MGKKLNKLKQEEDVMTDLTFESSQNVTTLVQSLMCVCMVEGSDIGAAQSDTGFHLHVKLHHRIEPHQYRSRSIHHVI